MILLVVFLTAYVALDVSAVPISLPLVDNDRINPEQLGGGFEGDMLFPVPLYRPVARGVAYSQMNKWPHGIVPYDISAITNAADRTMIENAMQHVVYDTGSPIINSPSRTVCVSFRPRVPSDATFLTIVYGQGCNAHVGYYARYPLRMTLQKDATGNCFHNGIIQHELLHVLGFMHEHSRPDRDNYVQINYANIDAQWYYAFDKQMWGTTAVDLQTNYDYSSIMHYGKDYFSKNGRPTIVPKRADAQIGSRDKLSDTDILEVRRFYGCQA